MVHDIFKAFIAFGIATIAAEKTAAILLEPYGSYSLPAAAAIVTTIIAGGIVGAMGYFIGIPYPMYRGRFLKKLKDPRVGERRWAASILGNGAVFSRSMEKLDGMQRAIEQAVGREVIAGQHACAVAERSATLQEFSLTLRMIAERKAELVKRKDGELLAGETIKRPRNDRATYQMTRMRRAV